MEPMDFDSEEPVYRHSSYRQASLSPPLPSVNRESDASDMDVDSNSPVQDSAHRQMSPRWSASLEHVSRAVSAVMSMSVGGKEPTDDNGGRMASKECEVSQATQRSHSWEPAATVVRGVVAFRKNKKTGYGIPDDDPTFSHFPGYVRDVQNERSLRQRSGNVLATPEASATPLNTKTAGQMSHPRGPPRKKLRVGSNETDVGQKSSKCTCKSVSLWTIFLFIIVCLIFYIHDWQDKRCKASKLFDKRSLEIDLESYVFGQEVASRMVTTELETYFHQLNTPSTSEEYSVSSKRASYGKNNVDLCKPLVMSFHGGTGVGKNFMSRIMSENLKRSKVMQFVIPHLFPHKVYNEIYSKQIQQWIMGNVTECKVSIFVIDEMDKAPPGVVSGIGQAVHSLSKPCHLAAPVIVLLLSNANAVEINRRFLSLRHAHPSSLIREKISDSKFMDIFKSESEWYFTLASSTIDVFVPFLPLEKSHVIQCIRRDLVAKGFSSNSDAVEKILRELSYSTFGDLHLSTTGCKRVQDKVDYVMMQVNSK
ncbi:torsin-1A [Aplysia californica]|uniref:Torsin-1A n=1 Tax=Aplysia californica TaxID=6500 RepID=A0ABM1VQV0_APLCA|nr:torsin-1A [Aplysia californica]XP_035824792.1 torsin-1A [Aplysia californica]